MRGSGCRASTATLAVCFRMLAVLIGSGIPIHVSLATLARTYRGAPLGEVLESMIAAIEKGASLSRTMAGFPATFPPIPVVLVSAGEETGRLPGVLDRVAELLERQERLRRRMIGAFLYPGLVLGITLLVVAVLVVVVFPRQREMFEALEIDRLPWITRAVMGFFDLLISPTLLSALAVLALVLAVTWPLTGRYYEEHLRESVDRWLLKVPIIGRVLEKLSTSMILYGLGNLLDAGGSFGRRTELLGRLSGNRDIEVRFLQAQELVYQGVRLDLAMERCDLFDPMVRSMLRVGVEQGSLASLCKRTASILQEDAEHVLSTLSVLLEPLALGFMGLVIGMIVLAASLPTMEAIQKL
ncbi:MAG: type II secretion system F family protein [Armatimonadetes bacterium]|nr:type II secretion system F family protein [Armatimonadota bacterium]